MAVVQVLFSVPCDDALQIEHGESRRLAQTEVLLVVQIVTGLLSLTVCRRQYSW